jgi:SAM-dependent methyltransferase
VGVTGDLAALRPRREPVEVRDGILIYASEAEVNWSDDLEALHEAATPDHFMDIETRRAIVNALAPALPGDGIAVDLGCSSGLLLADLHAARPDATLIGVDLVAAGLERARAVVPSATLVLADATDLPFGDATVDVLSAANVLEHVADDGAALAEIARVLRPGGRTALVVPLGPDLYDYYDAVLGHERRYAVGELAERAGRAGLELVGRRSVGSLLFPAFWLVKKRHRRAAPATSEAARARVGDDIARTRHSRIGAMLCRIESRLPRTPRFGIRELTVLTRR